MIESLVMIWFEYKRFDWKHVIWSGFDFSLCDLIWWFEQITTFSDLGQPIMITCCCFYCSWVKLLISVIVPSLIFAQTLTVRPYVHWWHFAHRLVESGTAVIWLTSWFGSIRDSPITDRNTCTLVAREISSKNRMKWADCFMMRIIEA